MPRTRRTIQRKASKARTKLHRSRAGEYVLAIDRVVFTLSAREFEILAQQVLDKLQVRILKHHRQIFAEK
jgi:hypothetical protein